MQVVDSDDEADKLMPKPPTTKTAAKSGLNSVNGNKDEDSHEGKKEIAMSTGTQVRYLRHIHCGTNTPRKSTTTSAV